MKDTIDNGKKVIELKGRILLVEDVVVNQKVILGMLNNFDLDIDVANNGVEALEKYKSTKYDLILMDCQMPIMDGFETTIKIRETDNDVVIIAVTANVMELDRLKCSDAGMNDYISKPVNRPKLISTIEYWLSDKPKTVSTNHPLGNEVCEDADIVVPEAEHGVLNYGKLQEMKVIMGDVFDGLVPAYIGQADEIVNDMMVVFDRSDIKTLERYAHSMKSSSHNVGADTLSIMSMELEDLSRNNLNPDELKIKIVNICLEYEKVRQALSVFNKQG